MAIASRRQSRTATGGTNFILHSMQITNSAVVAAWRFRPTPAGVAEEITRSDSNLNGSFVGSQSYLTRRHGPSGLHVFNLDGSNNLINIYSAALNTAIDLTTISISIWAKVDSAAQWTDSTQRHILQLKTDGNNLLEISKSTSDDVIDFDYTANSTADTEAVSTLIDNESPVTWFHLGLTVDDTNNSMFTYFNGVQGTEQTGIGTWSGALSSTDCVIGADTTTPVDPRWLGGISDLIIYNAILTPAEMLALSRVR